MPASPASSAEGVVRISVSSDGTVIPDALQIISVTVHRAVNAIPQARLELSDGDIATGTFPASEGTQFKPGAVIAIKAGYGDEETQIFEGVVVRHGLHIGDGNDARLVVECRDKATKMTIGRKHANFVDKKDSDILTALIGAYGGLTADVTATTVQYKELVQYSATDWDFVVTRAEVNGMLVVVTDGTVTIAPPDTAAEPTLDVAYGADLMEFHADMDARTQLQSVQATAWDPSNLAIVQGAAASPPTLNTQGDLDGATLAQVASPSSFDLRTPAMLDSSTLAAWGKARQVKAGLARIRGSMRFQGSALAQVGKQITVDGVGARFNGKVFVSAIRHEIRDGNWVTEAQFGLAPDWFAERPDVHEPPAAAWVPAVQGLQIGVVKKLDADPAGQHRVQVSIPVTGAQTDGVWARLLQFHASNAFGAFFVPEIGDEVLLGYLNDDPSQPVILGSLYSAKHAPPYTLAAENNTKAVVTRSKVKIEIDDKDKVFTITTPGNNKVVLSDKDKSILLQDQNSNKVTLDSGGITLDSPKDIKITAKGGITLDAVNAVSITSKADVKGSGLNVSFEAQVGFTGKGSATAELSASGQTTVKGAMVMIN